MGADVLTSKWLLLRRRLPFKGLDRSKERWDPRNVVLIRLWGPATESGEAVEARRGKRHHANGRRIILANDLK